MKNYKILVINPGSTSTKVAVYEGHKSVFLKTIRHSSEQISCFNSIADQYEFRKEIILSELLQSDIDIENIVAVVGRGGLVRPIESGVYEVTEKLKEDLRHSIQGEHASNLGGLIADDIAKSIKNARAFIADPVVVDELIPEARISGLPEMPRRSVFHALNQKMVAKNYAKSLDRKYEDMNLIVAHLGGGISIGVHRKGRVIDVNNALDGYGPFSPERAGTLPTGNLVDLCFSGKYTQQEIKKMINGKGGLIAHTGTNMASELEERSKNGDEHAALILRAMGFQIAKSIGSSAAVLCGKVDAIIITGGIAHDKKLCDQIKEMTGFIAPIVIMPGEDEMRALAENALAVLNGETELKIY
jgi:butyrate kinase